MVEPLKFELTLNESITIVWHAWTKTEEITKWFSPDAYIEPCPGGAYELFFDPSNHEHQSTKGCKITILDPMKILGFTWKGPDQLASLMNNPSSLTSVRVDFTARDEVTQINVEHSGWGEGKEWAEAINWHRKAWKGVLSNLKSMLKSICD